MIIKDTMQYIESEFTIINTTPCKFCKHTSYIIEDFHFEYIQGKAHHIHYCLCEECGTPKVFIFPAPYIASIDDEIMVDLELNSDKIN